MAKKTLMLAIAAALLAGCTAPKKREPMSVTAPVGSVVTLDVKSKPVTYKAETVSIIFAQNGILTTFTDESGNMHSVAGSATISNINHDKLRVTDMRDKKTDK